MKAIKKIIGRLTVGCVLACGFNLQLFADAYFLRSHEDLPYPLDPYKGALPIVVLDATNRIFQIQDTLADYAALMFANTNGTGSSTVRVQPRIPSSYDPSGFYLGLATDDDNYTRVVYFNTTPGSLYNIESSTNLTDWSVEQTFVATDTNYVYWTVADSTKFFRTVLPDNRLQFPNWDDTVEAFAYFNIYTTIRGTYHLELYGDGNLLYQTTASIPTNGYFGVYDSSYDSSQWPNVGDYSVDDWQLIVTVTPSVVAHTPGNNGNASANLHRRQLHSTSPRYGLTVEREGVGAGVAPGIQDDIDDYTLGYLQTSGYTVANQYALDTTYIDPSTAIRTTVPKLTDTNSWGQFKFYINSPYLTDLHYYGHGSRQGIGDSLSDPTTSISLAEFQNTNRLAHPLKYAFLDGCNTASGDHVWQSSKLLAALCGYNNKPTLAQAAASGKHVRFAWGWETKKIINFAGGTHLQTGHFEFIADFYNYLAKPDSYGVLSHSYDSAFYFALHPNGAGVDPYATDNPDGYFYDYLGCGWGTWPE